MHKYWCTIRFIFVINLLLAVFIQYTAFAQATGDPREDFLYGEYYLSMGQFQKALPFFLSSLLSNPGNCNMNYRTGMCFLKIVGRQHEALPYLKKAVLEINDHYVEGKYKETGAPVEAWLLLGEAYHRENNLQEASKAYHKYRELIADTDKKMLEVVMERITGLGISYEFQRDEDQTIMLNLGEEINSRFSDYNPVLSGDQSIMFYTQYWESYDRVMMTQNVNGKWTSPIEMNDQIGSHGNCYTTALSFDGTELYLVRYDEIDYDIVVTKLNKGVWSKIKEIKGKVNSRYRETSVSISSDGNIMYFASDRPGGEGGFDIYKAQKHGDTWGNITNLGVGINTEKNEEAPYISYDGIMLFFSSNGHETIGNLDVLHSELDELGNWTRPQNLGSPINTTNDDLFYVYFKDSKEGYFSRDYPGGFGKNDIFILKGSIIEPSTKEEQPDFIDRPTNDNSSEQVQTDETLELMTETSSPTKVNTDANTTNYYNDNSYQEESLSKSANIQLTESNMKLAEGDWDSRAVNIPGDIDVLTPTATYKNTATVGTVAGIATIATNVNTGSASSYVDSSPNGNYSGSMESTGIQDSYNTTQIKEDYSLTSQGSSHEDHTLNYAEEHKPEQTIGYYEMNNISNSRQESTTTQNNSYQVSDDSFNKKSSIADTDPVISTPSNYSDYGTYNDDKNSVQSSDNEGLSGKNAEFIMSTNTETYTKSDYQPSQTIVSSNSVANENATAEGDLVSGTTTTYAGKSSPTPPTIGNNFTYIEAESVSQNNFQNNTPITTEFDSPVVNNTQSSTTISSPTKASNYQHQSSEYSYTEPVYSAKESEETNASYVSSKQASTLAVYSTNTGYNAVTNEGYSNHKSSYDSYSESELSVSEFSQTDPEINSSNSSSEYSYNKSYNNVVYTVQIYALKNWIEKEKITLSPLSVSTGDDGYYRYTYGEYQSETQAMQQLDSILKMGYWDAFIRTTVSVQNYRGN